MTDLTCFFSALRRPKILVRAARVGVRDYRRERDLKRIRELPRAERLARIKELAAKMGGDKVH